MKVDIKKMEASDIDAIFEIEKSAYGEHHWSKESFYNELQNNIGYYIVAHEPSIITSAITSSSRPMG